MSRERCTVSANCVPYCSSYDRRRECAFFYWEKNEIPDNRRDRKFRPGYDKKTPKRPLDRDGEDFQPWRVKAKPDGGKPERRPIEIPYWRREG